VPDADDLGLPVASATPTVSLGAAHQERRRGVVSKDLIIGVQPCARVKDDANRVVAGHQSGGQPRIIRSDRLRAYHDTVAKGAHAVQMNNVLRPGDIVRVARSRSDAAVEALTQMADGEAFTTVEAAKGQIEIEQIP
jgi:hypothetical protein